MGGEQARELYTQLLARLGQAYKPERIKGALSRGKLMARRYLTDATLFFIQPRRRIWRNDAVLLDK